MVDPDVAVREYDDMRLAQVCLALGVAFDVTEDGVTRHKTWPEVLFVIRFRTRAWSTLVHRAEAHDAAWLTEWQRQPEETDQDKRWVWNPMSQTYEPPGDSDERSEPQSAERGPRAGGNRR